MAVRARPPTKNCHPGKQDAVVLAREDADQAGRKGTRDGGGQDKTLAVERKAKGAVRARKVDERDAGKAQYAAEHLGRIELLGAKRQSGKEDG